MEHAVAGGARLLHAEVVGFERGEEKSADGRLILENEDEWRMAGWRDRGDRRGACSAHAAPPWAWRPVVSSLGIDVCGCSTGSENMNATP